MYAWNQWLAVEPLACIPFGKPLPENDAANFFGNDKRSPSGFGGDLFASFGVGAFGMRNSFGRAQREVPRRERRLQRSVLTQMALATSSVWT
jgi:hypothetical protein